MEYAFLSLRLLKYHRVLLSLTHLFFTLWLAILFLWSLKGTPTLENFEDLDLTIP